MNEWTKREIKDFVSIVLQAVRAAIFFPVGFAFILLIWFITITWMKNL